MSDAELPEPSLPGRSPALGRFLAGSVVAMFVMVTLGVFWVWQRAQREQDWRERVNAAEPFTAPTNRLSR